MLSSGERRLKIRPKEASGHVGDFTSEKVPSDLWARVQQEVLILTL